jgi:hypothetical protein
MAAAVTQVSLLSDWKVASHPGYALVPFGSCCETISTLPRRFVEAVRATAGGGGDGGSMTHDGSEAAVV